MSPQGSGTGAPHGGGHPRSPHGVAQLGQHRVGSSPGSLSAAAPAARGFAPELFAGELARGPHAIGTVVGARAGPRPMRSRRFGLDLAVRYVDKTDGRKR
jgi:hypothetical protein